MRTCLVRYLLRSPARCASILRTFPIWADCLDYIYSRQNRRGHRNPLRGSGRGDRRIRVSGHGPHRGRELVLGERPR